MYESGVEDPFMKQGEIKGVYIIYIESVLSVTYGYLGLVGLFHNLAWPHITVT